MTTEQSSDTNKELLFNENEKVLCYHGPLIYEAKVSKTILKQGYSISFFLMIVDLGKELDGRRSRVNWTLLLCSLQGLEAKVRQTITIGFIM